MKYFEFYNPVKICAGENAVSHLAFELESLNVKNPLILSDSTLNKLGLVKKVIDIAKIENYSIYTEIPVDSGVEVVNKIVKMLETTKVDGIVAIGGGSVIDTAKGVKMAYGRTGDLSKIMGLEVVSRLKEIPFIVLPTTAGTGSEVTNVAVIKDEKTDVKMEFITPYLMPNVAIIDPILTVSLPSKVTASTGFDALCHAIEGYSCMQKNPISDAYAINAIKLIYDNLETACKEPKNVEARLNMAVGSTLAGLCFGNSMVGAVHAIGHSLGSVCHIAHGDAMAILLPHVMEYNKEKLAPIYATLAPIFAQNLSPKMSDQAKADLVISSIKSFRDELQVITGMPIYLSQTGKYDKTKAMEIAQGAINDGSMLVNPVAMNKNDVLRILIEAE